MGNLASIRKVREKLEKDNIYRTYIHLSATSIQDDIARDSALKLNSDNASSYYKVLAYNFLQMDSQSDSDDQTELRILENDTKQIQINTMATESTNEVPVKIPKIDKFNPKNNVDAWIDNSCFILEMSGLRDQKKILSHLLGGLDQNLLLSVRQTLQAKEKSDESEELSTEDFRAALRLAAHQTDSDLVRQMAKLKYNDEMNSMKDLYLKISALNQALFPKIKDENTRTNLDTREFKEKVPKDVKNHSVFKSSDKVGFELVALAQRLFDAGRNEVESNFNRTRGSSRHQNNRYQNNRYSNNRYQNNRYPNHRYQNNRYQNNRSQRNDRNYNNRENFRTNSDKPNYNRNKNEDRNQGERNFRNEIRCNFCHNLGHIEADCRTKKRLQQEYLGRDRKHQQKND